MKSKETKNKERSIFPDMMNVEGNAKSFNILEEMEILSSRADANYRFLGAETSGEEFSRRNIADLVKMGYKLPDVDSPERMLLGNMSESRELGEEASIEDDPYRMVNLISRNFRLPEVDRDLDENFLR